MSSQPDQELRQQFACINGYCHHDGKDCPIYESMCYRDEIDHEHKEDLEKMLDTMMAALHSHMQTAFDDKYSIGETVFNNSGWGVGSSGTPLRIKSILLEVDWEGSKSSRYLKSSDVSHKWLGGDK